MPQVKIDKKAGYITTPSTGKRCGNCSHLMSKNKNKEEDAFLKELASGKCELTGKNMSGSLIAGCFYWRERGVVNEK
jgi:hypothetical protein